MEHFTSDIASAPAPTRPLDGAGQGAPALLIGVVASGNLEVLVEPMLPRDAGICRFEIHTAAVGFRETWDAVLADFARRHAAGGLQFLLNDVGATPAVVALRLAQAHERWLAAGASA